MEYQLHTLSNGIRLVHRHADNTVSHCGIIIGAGSRNEETKEHGLAHFIEHGIFKGTTKRKVYHVLSRLEIVGSDLNAYTTKEETCIYASFLNRYYDRTLELISDITFNSTFPEKELKKEKDVIIEEINSYRDNPAEMIFDDFEELLFDGHPLGRNILGTKKNIKLFDKAKIDRFMANNYHTDRMVICSVGKINFRKLITLVEKYFSGISSNFNHTAPVPFLLYKPAKRSVKKRNFQTHCMIGNIAYNYNDNHRMPMALLNNLLGGPGLNSRLNLAIREKHGLAYNNESNFSPYSDTGVFSIYLGIDNGSVDKTLHYVYNELKLLREKKLGAMQLRTAKRQFIGQLAIFYEQNLSRMLSMGKSLLLSDKVMTLEAVNEKIDSVSAAEISEIANEVFDPDQLSVLTYLSK
ncbi:MAG: insulinase family protein [Bacteroidales bacterium]|nr:insulinase family protein [Bacteroidales bacterium]